MKEALLRFELEIISWGDEEQKLLCPKIIINNIPLIETVRVHELPYAKDYSQESIAGDYIYNLAESFYKLLSFPAINSLWSMKINFLY